MSRVPVTATVNGRRHTFEVLPQETLLDALRENLGLTGTKRGCEIGECGACTVLLDGRPVNACLVPAAQVEGCTVLTVEGLASGGRLNALQEAFLDHDAVQCGFCTPGMLLAAHALLEQGGDTSDAGVRAAIAGNLCRCTGYQQIVDAIRAAAGATPAMRKDP
jgi:carbon-monoxide dehydrogenase small subunit